MFHFYFSQSCARLKCASHLVSKLDWFEVSVLTESPESIAADKKLLLGNRIVLFVLTPQVRLFKRDFDGIVCSLQSAPCAKLIRGRQKSKTYFQTQFRIVFDFERYWENLLFYAKDIKALDNLKEPFRQQFAGF